ELVELGGASLRSPFLRPIAIIVRLLFTPAETYRWVLTEGKGAGNQLFTCIKPSYELVAPQHVRGELTLADGYPPCREFFLVVKGSFIESPRLVGLPPANVDMLATERSARYDIRFAAGGGSLAWLRRAIAWPFTARAAARELKEAHEELPPTGGL